MTINKDLKTKLRELKIPEAIDFLEANNNTNEFNEISFETQLELLLEDAISKKNANRIKKYINGAKFSIKSATMENIQYEGREIDKREIQRLATNNYIANHINLLISGPTGCGKTWMACALGNKACRSLIRTRYIRMQTLLEIVKNAKLTNRQSTNITKFGNYDLLIIDEWLLRKINDEEINIIFEILERRVNKTTIVCTQYEVGDWMTMMKVNPISDSIISRISDCSIPIRLDDTNMREAHGKKVLARYNSLN